VNITNRNKIIVFIIIIFTGLAVVLYPYFTDRAYHQKIERQKKLYFHHTSCMENKMNLLYRELKRRNEQLYITGQERFSNILSYEKSTINLKLYGINNNTVGYIVIPEMKVNLPIILGANEENMKKGAVHLTETSYPIGGENTNCVIAAHRGYSKTAMFRDIQKLEIGDKVFVENFKEKLVYRVVQLRIISPTDTDQVLIKEGKDMLTLITCHPYRKNSQRYVVFCERI
jgi:sortase A